MLNVQTVLSSSAAGTSETQFVRGKDKQCERCLSNYYLCFGVVLDSKCLSTNGVGGEIKLRLDCGEQSAFVLLTGKLTVGGKSTLLKHIRHCLLNDIFSLFS